MCWETLPGLCFLELLCSIWSRIVVGGFFSQGNSGRIWLFPQSAQDTAWGTERAALSITKLTARGSFSFPLCSPKQEHLSRSQRSCTGTEWSEQQCLKLISFASCPAAGDGGRLASKTSFQTSREFLSTCLASESVITCVITIKQISWRFCQFLVSY